MNATKVKEYGAGIPVTPDMDMRKIHQRAREQQKVCRENGIVFVGKTSYIRNESGTYVFWTRKGFPIRVDPS